MFTFVYIMYCIYVHDSVQYSQEVRENKDTEEKKMTIRTTTFGMTIYVDTDKNTISTVGYNPNFRKYLMRHGCEFDLSISKWHAPESLIKSFINE